MSACLQSPLRLRGADSSIDPAVRTLAVLALALVVPIYNIVAVVVLVASGGAAPGQPGGARTAYLRKLGVAGYEPVYRGLPGRTAVR